ncbi:hypothetical protein [Alicyclobacillus tolerans]|uniref:PH domain-containing protein n=1 Tax=Alicyclobacillus tolerans TaxID=90970 RepID=A0ABT9LUX5_9BACL|nr:hypothetical protein [Alicyclobacillus tengchongensis]MDP9728065.1 hypothetical protein [Alicyclobacillus tengchongensis]
MDIQRLAENVLEDLEHSKTSGHHHKTEKSSLDVAMERVLKQMIEPQAAEPTKKPEEQSLASQAATVLRQLAQTHEIAPIQTEVAATSNVDTDDVQHFLSLLLEDVERMTEEHRTEPLAHQPFVSSSLNETPVASASNVSSGVKRVPVNRHPFRLVSQGLQSGKLDDWIQRFYKLHEETRVLGWMAYQNGHSIASDRDYDEEIEIVLLQYLQTLQNLQQQIEGMNLDKSSIHSVQGQINFYWMEDNMVLIVFTDSDHYERDWLQDLLSAPVAATVAHGQ